MITIVDQVTVFVKQEHFMPGLDFIDYTRNICKKQIHDVYKRKYIYILITMKKGNGTDS